MLWALNLFALGPIAVTVAGAGGAMHRLDPANIPWLTAILWAPLVEELLFRYGLRRPAQALWFCPMVLPAILWGAQGWTLALVAVAVWLAWLSLRRGRASLAGWDTSWRRYYSYRFGLVFHLVALTFAAVHLNNFSLSQTPCGCCRCWCCPNGPPAWCWDGCGCGAASARRSRCTRCSTAARY